MKLGSRPTPLELQRALAAALDMVRAGRTGPAIRLLKDISRHRPGDFDALHLLGTAQVLDGRRADGIRVLQQAAAVRPAAPAVWINLGGALEQEGRHAEAADAYASALAASPAHGQANHRRCLALLAAGQVPQAALQAEAFVAAHQGLGAGHLTLGLVRLHQARQDDAIACMQTALRLEPGNTLAAANLAFVLGSAQRYEEVVPLLDAVVRQRPADWAALEKLVHAKRCLCDWTGLAALEQRLVAAVVPERASVDPWALFSVTDRADVLKHAAIARSATMAPRLPPALRSAHAFSHPRIRLGYLSGDYRDHPVAHVVAPLIAAHDRQRFEVVGISCGPPDASPVRARLAAGFDSFVDMAHANPLAVAQRLRDLEIDIAIDLSGPTETGLPQVLLHRPAPVQVSFLGYPGTTGAPWMDYLIADPVTVPAGHDRYFTEHVVRLPDSYFPPSRRAIAAGPPSRREAGLPDGALVLASFNNSYKLSPAVFDVWMRVLSNVPGSVLWLRAAGEAVEDRLRAAAAARGVGAGRLIFAPRLDDESRHLARLALADLFLDSWPYNAHTTASDALWAGLPVLTAPGQSFASRVAASLLEAAGLSELVAPDLAAYEATALALAREPERLAGLRARLVAGRDGSRLCDLDRYRRHLESAYLVMHERARKGQKHGPITIGGT